MQSRQSLYSNKIQNINIIEDEKSNYSLRASKAIWILSRNGTALETDEGAGFRGSTPRATRILSLKSKAEDEDDDEDGGSGVGAFVTLLPRVRCVGEGEGEDEGELT